MKFPAFIKITKISARVDPELCTHPVSFLFKDAPTCFLGRLHFVLLSFKDEGESETTFSRPAFKKELYRRTYSKKKEWVEDQDTSNSGTFCFPDYELLK